jgi:hypothetical protein
MKQILAFVFVAVLGAAAICTLPAFTVNKTTQVWKHARYSQPVPIEVAYTKVGPLVNGAVVGTFTAESEIFPSGMATGTFTMVPTRLGQALHCTIDLATPYGEINAVMECNEMTMLGNWHIVDASGAYADVTGGGKVDMNSDGHWPRHLYGKVKMD